MKLISPEYYHLNKELHQINASYGVSGVKYADHVLHIAMTMDEKKVLDYGCGKCTLNLALPMLDVTNYDPCIDEYAEKPVPHPLVVCTDVLEHIEPDCLEDVLDHLLALTEKAVFLAVSTRPAMKFLSDGRNAHLIIQPVEMWLPMLTKRWKPLGVMVHKGHFTFTGITYAFWKYAKELPDPEPVQPPQSIGFQA